MLHSGTIEISPLAYMRGRTFKKAFVIADEMQNSSPNQMLMLTTRLGDGSKMVITGDLNQSDRAVDNGLKDFMQKLSLYRGDNEYIRMIEMDVQDVQRSEAVSKILDIYSQPKSFNNTSVNPLPTISLNTATTIREPFPVCSDCALIPNDPFLR
jgi:phosphate starvation-inducible PhoH-like protein